VLLSFSGWAQAATYYVSPAGNDANPGDPNAPFQHVSRGASAAQAGDTVVVMDGTYDNEGQVAQPGGGGYVVTLSNSGVPGAPITIMAQNRGGAILNAASSARSPLGCYGAWAYFDASHVSYVVIQGFIIENACLSGVHINGTAHDITVKWNEIRNIGKWDNPTNQHASGTYLNPNEYNITFDGNVFHDIGGASNNLEHAIYSYSSNLIVINNIFFNQVHGWDIQIAGGSNIFIGNNTFAYSNPNRDGQIILWESEPLSNVVIENNIFYQPPSTAVVSWQAGSINGCTIANNLTTSGSISDNGSNCAVANNLAGVDPNFVNGVSGPLDFHLQPGSPAIGSGIIYPFATSDLEGRPRPTNAGLDLGALQTH
jgi:parallel beta helix pectate lyase-like protein/uncharacterized protein DUF1565